LTSVRERQQQKRITETTEERENRLDQDNNRRRKLRSQKAEGSERNDETTLRNQRNQTVNMDIDDQQSASEINTPTHSATNISIHEQRILQNFRNKINDIEYN